MAGHKRTIGTARAAVGTTGRIRKDRVHLPPGEGAAKSETVRRETRNGARAMAAGRIGRTGDPVKKVSLAFDFVRSAAAKYQPEAGVADEAVQALLKMGDRIFASGQPVTAAQKHRRKIAAHTRRETRNRNARLMAAGKAAVRQQHREWRNQPT